MSLDAKHIEATRVVCPSCGLAGDDFDGPVDPYGASSSACWAKFGELRLAGLPQLGLDAYMAQHPNPATPAGRRSILTHLVGLHLALNGSQNSERIIKILGLVFPDKSTEVEGFAKIPNLAGITVAEVLDIAAPSRSSILNDWALLVWNAWGMEHDRVIDLANSAVRRLGR